MNKAARKRSIARRAVLYTVITTATIVITTFLGLYTFGFRFDLSLNKVERTGLIQFGSSPSGAVSKVDGNAVQFRTPNKTVVNAGKHTFTMERDKYNTWEKTLNIKPGTLRWLNYAILVPKNIETTPVLSYDSINSIKSTPEKKDILILKDQAIPSFDLIDIRSSEVKVKTLDLPLETYSMPDSVDVPHRFEMVDWDEGGRYMLLKHNFGEASEWIVLDTQNISNSQNLTKHFDLQMASVKFIDTSGNKFYALNNTDIRKLDLSNSTISQPLVTRVESFVLYDKNYIAYIGQDGEAEKVRRVVGTYRDGDKSSHVIKSFSIDQYDIKVAVTKYFNEDYIAVQNEKVLTLLKGNFPTDGNNGQGLKTVMTLSLAMVPSSISFSESGQYIMMQNITDFVTYDLEYQIVAKFNVNVPEDTFDAGWLNSTHLWSYADGKVSIREFDGENSHVITNAVDVGEVIFTNNKKYIYTINKNTDGLYVLQRSLMILR